MGERPAAWCHTVPGDPLRCHHQPHQRLEHIWRLEPVVGLVAAEALPFEDASFDVVASLIGAMFGLTNPGHSIF
jgi:hypothetical protein